MVPHSIWKLNQQPLHRRSVFFNSFFLQKLFDEKNNDILLSNQYNYSQVQSIADKYFQRHGVLVSEAKNIFCPYNYSQTHWGLGVIQPLDKRVIWYDSNSSNMSHGRCAKVNRLMDGLVHYMYDEYWKIPKEGDPMTLDEWKREWRTSICTTCPQQLNG